MKRLFLIALLHILGALACAQISFIGSCTGTTSCASVPAHQTGDLFLVYAAADATTTAPTTCSGFTSMGTASINGTGSADSVVKLMCRSAPNSSTTITSCTGASQIIGLIYRGSAKVAGGTCATDMVGTPSFFTSTVNTTTTTETFNAITNQDSNSWDVGFGYAPAATAGIGTAPTGMTNRTSNGTVMGAHDTNGGVSSFSSANVTLTTAGRIITATAQIKAYECATPTYSTEPGTFNTVGGVYLSTIQSLTADNSTCTICYTTDGSTPTGSGGSCTAGNTLSGTRLLVGSSETLKSVGTIASAVTSPVKSSTYNLITPQSMMPVVGAGKGSAPSPSASNVSYVASSFRSGTNDASGTSLATSSTVNVPAGDLIVACVTSAYTNSLAVSTVGDGGSNSLTFVTKSANATGGDVEIWYKQNSSANATATFTATWPAGGTTFRRIYTAVFAGASTSAALDHSACFGSDCATQAASSTDRTALNISTVNLNELVLACSDEQTAAVNYTAIRGFNRLTTNPSGEGMFYNVTTPVAFYPDGDFATSDASGAYQSVIASFK